MLLAIALVILAIIVFGIGIFVKALWWLFVIAAVIFVVGLISGALGRKNRV